MPSAPQKCQLTDLENQVYAALEASSSSTSALQSPIPFVIVITDISKDYDDMSALLILAELHRLRLIDLRAIVTNLMPAIKRAKFARRMMDLLGLGPNEVPVGKGMRACVVEHLELSYEFGWEQEAISTMNDEDFPDGQQVLLDAYTAAKREGRKVTVVLISSSTDIDKFTTAHEDLFKEMTASIEIQGYNEFKDGLFIPREDSPAANNRFDPPAAKRFHTLIQKLCIPSTTFTKFIAYTIPLRADLFVQLADSGHPIGTHLNWLHYEITREFYAQSLHTLYKEDHTPQLVLRTRTSWYEKHSADADLPDPEEIRPYLNRPILYDAIAALNVLRPEDMKALASVGSPEWGVRLPYEPNMRGGTIHGEVGQAKGEDILPTFHPQRVALIISALMKGALLNAPTRNIPFA